MGWQVLFAHRLGQQQHFQFDIQRTIGLIPGIEQVSQWLRVTFRAGRLRTAERLQRFGGHHPRRDAGNKALGQERAQRLVFPGLDIPRRPVVEQAETGNMLACFADRDRVAHVIALANPDPQFQLVVQP